MSTSVEQPTHDDLSSPAIVVQQYVDAFNRGDEDGLAACFADFRVHPRRDGPACVVGHDCHAGLA